MTPAAPALHTLDHGGHSYAVDMDSAGLHSVARLFVDGQPADEQKGMDKAIHLQGGDLTVVVKLNWLGHASEILAVPRGTEPRRAEAEGIAFTPPAGSQAARMAELRRTRPALYAARHVALAIVQVVVGFLGVGALLWGLVQGLLPRINLPRPELPDIPWPAFDIDVPSIPWPDIPWPEIPLPDLSILAPLQELWGAVRWLIPIVIAVIVALNEIDKRRKREQAAARRVEESRSRGVEKIT